ncbi:MAG: secretin N-terminal domain-containing protein [Thermodesulfobacteriota bacterium]
MMQRRQRLFHSMILFLPFFFLAGAGAGYADTAVIPVQYRWASEALPVISHFLSSNGVATVDERTNSIIIVDAADNLKNIKEFLKQFDQPVKRVRIRLRFNEALSSLDQSVSVTGGVSGGKWGVTVGDKNKDGVDVRISDTKGRGEQASEYLVQTTSGGTAYILTGREIPYRDNWGRYCRGDGPCPDSVSFQKADTGMEIKAVIVGDRANVVITPRLSHFEPNQRGGIIRYSAAATQLSAPLGQWVTIGGADNKSSEAFREIVGGGRDSRESSFSMELMVETY